MAFRFQRGSFFSRSKSSKSRRPQGVSRRQRKRQFTFETLEDRRVMSADSPLPYLPEVGTVLQAQSYSSADEAGQMQILLNELYWQSLIENSIQHSTQTGYTTDSVPTDPLIQNQWHLVNNGLLEVGNPDFQPIYGSPGEDINLAPVWAMGLTGEGVIVGVFDTGTQTDHPDLADNISPTLQLNTTFGFADGNPTFNDSHGTAVAGLIGAVANNGLGGAGVAPGVTIAPVNLLSGPFTAQERIDAFQFATNELDITNNSWGLLGARTIIAPTVGELTALRDSVNFGRDGLGVIHVFSSGNNAGSGFNDGFQDQGLLDSTTYDGFKSSRYTIAVTGVDHDGFYNNADGTFTSYPETSAGVLVAAPTGSVALAVGNDTGVGSGIITTDLTGELGSNVEGFVDDRDFLEDTDYTSRFNGTSASAPIASGVIALMLEANPNLSWRDVQEILVRSARQNSEFDVPTIGNAQGGGFFGSTQNLWIQNQMPVFHDPDPISIASGFAATLNPTLDPNIHFNHYVPTPMINTNGAGYTVSQGSGVFGEETGYAHGVIDAELAVLLAQQWGINNQTLPEELTFTTSPILGQTFFDIPASEVGNEDSGEQLVPGSLSGESGFIDYWNEYFAEVPFSGDDPPTNRRGVPISFSVPDSAAMTIETVEVKVNIQGGTAAALDHLRILLVSPDGTHSELNHFYVQQDEDGRFAELQNLTPATKFIVGGAGSSGDGDLVATFTTNRSWGERSDDSILYDATTREPVLNTTGFGDAKINRQFGNIDEVLTQGWTVHFENYGTTDLELHEIELVFHGSPIVSPVEGVATQRVQGLIGIDENRDDEFSFSRVDEFIFGAAGAARYGEVINFVDNTHESMASNITVVATDSNGVIVDEFLTGADGNYYFDLVPGDYTISIVDPLERTALDHSTVAGSFLQDYKTEWTITEDFFRAWDYDESVFGEVKIDVIDGVRTPQAFLDGNGNEVVTGMKHINFLLDPGDEVDPVVDFSGAVFADINGDGEFNDGDVYVPGVRIFGDVNRNGQVDPGEQIVDTDGDGEYSLSINLDPSLSSTIVNVGVIPPAEWTFSDPSGGFTPFFVRPGDSITTDLATGISTNFAITPPVGEGAGNGTNQDGYLLGVVFTDLNGDGQQQGNVEGQIPELGSAGIVVYIDANGSGAFEAGERITTTNSTGAFIFDDVAPGSHVVRLELPSEIIQIFPENEGPQVVTLAGGGTVSNILFGLQGTIIIDPEGGGGLFDFGDLPASYGITAYVEGNPDLDGARHPVGVYFLGASVDGDAIVMPSDDADGDDNIGVSDGAGGIVNDEDGIVVDELIPGTLGRLVATASLYGGYLQGWVDFDGDGTFDGEGERIITNMALVPGENELFFDVPDTLTLGAIYARFRYGEYGIDSVTGPAVIGEVEDYKLRDGLPAQVALSGPDFDDDGDVDGLDFLSWQLGFGMGGAAVQSSDGDSNNDNHVDISDLANWEADLGNIGPAAASAPLAATFVEEEPETFSGLGFLSWQAAFDGDAEAEPIAEDDAPADVPLLATASPVESAAAPLSLSSSAAFVAPQVEVVPEVVAIQAPVAAAPVIANSVETVISTPRFVASSNDADTSNSGARQVALASLASRLNLVEDFGLSRLERRNGLARFENRASEYSYDRSVDVEELGREVQDRVLDRLASRRQRPAELADRLTRRADVSEEAMSAAIGEEIDWRFF